MQKPPTLPNKLVVKPGQQIYTGIETQLSKEEMSALKIEVINYMTRDSSDKIGDPCTFETALVNLVDTVVDGRLAEGKDIVCESEVRLTDHDRAAVYMEFILRHLG